MTYEKFLLNDKQIISYPNGLREFSNENNGLNKCLEKLFPNNIFIHDKYLKIDNKYITNVCNQKIRPDYICHELKLVVEYDGFQHYTDPLVIIKDKYNIEILKSLGYTVIRIPYYIQLDKYTIKHYFDLDYNNILYETYNDHGFIHPLATLPSYFCEHGINKFKYDLKTLPKNIVDCIINSLKYRLNFYKTQLNDISGDIVIPSILLNFLK